MTLDIRLHVHDEPRPTMAVMVRGGISIRVDGVRLNRYADESSHDWLHDWYPEYVGEHLLLDLRELAECAVALARDEVELFDVRRVDLVETSDAFVLERVSSDQIRIAFQKSRGFGRESRLPTGEAALGALVSIDEFVVETLESVETAHAAAERFEITDDTDYEPFAAVREELRSTPAE